MKSSGQYDFELGCSIYPERKLHMIPGFRRCSVKALALERIDKKKLRHELCGSVRWAQKILCRKIDTLLQ